MGMVYDCHIGIVIVPLAVQKVISKLPLLPVCPYHHLLLEIERAEAQQHADEDERKYKFIEGDTTAEYGYKLVVGIEVSQSIGNGEQH